MDYKKLHFRGCALYFILCYIVLLMSVEGTLYYLEINVTSGTISESKLHNIEENDPWEYYISIPLSIGGMVVSYIYMHKLHRDNYECG